MTKQRKFKRRVRERQQRTGESYTTARRQLLAGRSDDAPPDSEITLADPPSAAGSHAIFVIEPPEVCEPARSDDGQAEDFAFESPNALTVVELLDVSQEAARRGFLCRVAMYPSLVDLADPTTVLATVRSALVGTVGDSATELLCAIALTGQPPTRITRVRDLASMRRFFQRARAGIGGASEDGRMLALAVAGREGLVPVLCTVRSYDGGRHSSIDDGHPALVLMAVEDTDEAMEDLLEAHEPRRVRIPSPRTTLYLIHHGRRFSVIKDRIIIGRDPKTADFQINDGVISRSHAAVIRRNGLHYLKDLGSTAGIVYKGMKIDSKRIDEGDVFHLANHELRFTFRADG
jgi:hypothetical protein